MLAVAVAAMAVTGAAHAQQRAATGQPSAGQGAAASQATPLRPCQSLTTDEPTYLTLGKSRVVRLPFPAVRMVVGGQPGGRVGTPVVAPPPVPGAPAAPSTTTAPSDGVAETDITLISPTELYFLGRRAGSMNVVVQAADGRCLVKDIVVTVDPGTLQSTLATVMPQERDVRVTAAQDTLVLTGTVSDTIKLDRILGIAGSYADPKKVINLLSVAAPQQVMLEVTIAEVSKNILDNLDMDFTRMFTTADGAVSKVISGIFGGGAAAFGRFSPNLAGGAVSNVGVASTAGSSAAAASQLSSTSRGSTLVGVDAKNRDGIIRVLAEPNIMAISGQSASFLSGGKIFIPVAQDRQGGGTTITLEEKEFGVGLKFTPTVLDGTRINLKLVSEASELQQTGSPFTSFNGTTAILPSMSTRRIDTTVQLNDGQSFMIAGLIKNNLTASLDKFPGLGEVPVMGALFRSTEFQNDQTELMFVVTPRLVKPLGGTVARPTDNHVAPTRGQVIGGSKLEGRRALQPATARGVTPATAVAPAAPANIPPASPPAAQSTEAPSPATVTPVAPPSKLEPLSLAPAEQPEGPTQEVVREVSTQEAAAPATARD
jgi:pilus assembly protein CpaC